MLERTIAPISLPKHQNILTYMARRLVIGDIHGCIDTFRALLDKVALSPSDTLYLLGDYIDKGADSGAVIDQILELQARRYAVVALRGNHEENLIHAHENYNPKTLRAFVGRISKSWTLLDGDGKIQQRYLDFAYSLPDYHDTGDFILVHAGLNFKLEDPFSDRLTLLGERRWQGEADMAKIGMRRIVHGHQPTCMEDIRRAVASGDDILPLDAGCVYTQPRKGLASLQLGHLCCLDLDSQQLTFQKNIDRGP
jgi:serine/threonine protein phosphatase 1